MMHFVAIPTTEQALRKYQAHWLPFLPKIAERSNETIDDLLDLVITFRMQIGVIWDDERREARALIGLQYRKAGPQLIGEVHWVTGFGAKEWQHCLEEIEQYLKDHVRCTIIKPICRPGWKPLLKSHGYRMTHLMMEKSL